MKRALTVTATVVAAALLQGCATPANKAFETVTTDNLNALVKSGQLVAKTDSFLVINDSSSSMSRDYTGSSGYNGTKLDKEKALLHAFNQTIPAIPLTSALRSFGFGPCLSWSNTQLNQALQPYSAAAFDQSLQSLSCSSGGTPLAEALSAAQHDLAAAKGQLALLVFSDGRDETASVAAADQLKTQYGDRLCIHTVWVGNPEDQAGQAILRDLAETSGCGIASEASQLSTAAGMSDFVKAVFLKPGKPVTVAPADDDHDGVINPKDKCPNTPRGAVVDADGCWAFHGVLFDFDRDTIKDKYHPMIENAVEVLRLNPELTIAIEGHTDSDGSDAYNQALSERRALSVKKALIAHGVNGSRLSTHGHGESQPVASNDSDEGRAYNRRVVYRRTDQ
jgi:OOP family OmpA-OmpF porin